MKRGEVARMLVAQVQRYLRDGLGIPVVEPVAWNAQIELPYHVRDRFEFFESAISGTSVVLVVDPHSEHTSLRTLRRALDAVGHAAHGPVLFVTNALASDERRQLIQQRISFVVPNNQAYLPELGLDLRDRFRRPAPRPDSRLSPATQAMLITALLRPTWQELWRPHEAATTLGYTPMTLSRAVRELVAAGVVRPRATARATTLDMAGSAGDVWQRARPLMTSPVRRTVSLDHAPTGSAGQRLAGLSALAQHTSLAAPAEHTYAVGRLDWRTLQHQDPIGTRDRIDASQVHCEIWNYSTALGNSSDEVDPCSLILSLAASPDERVQAAVEELNGQLPW